MSSVDNKQTDEVAIAVGRPEAMPDNIESPVTEKNIPRGTAGFASFYERFILPLPFPARCGMNFFMLASLMYLFLLGLDLMGNAFKGMSGKGVGDMLTSVSNPLSGIAIGILGTVLLQSSSTTTSIIVTMVGADILDVVNAIPMVMGANIGTSVTNTIVAHVHVMDRTEFFHGMQGATVHDAFNFLTVLTMLPIEVITQAIGGGLLLSMSEAMADGLVGESASTFTSPVKILVGPLSKAFISINKDLIKGIAKGCIECTIGKKDIETGSTGVVGTVGCKDDSRKDKAKEKIKMCVPPEQWRETYPEGNIIKGGFSADMGDIGGSLFILIISLIFLCVALYGIVRILHYLVLSSGRVETEDGRDAPFVRYTRKVLRISPYLSILFGMILTILVQSSSITTSSLTPLVAIQIITVEDMLPLTIGANLGTTCTAFLASLVTEKKSAIQIALCHLWFNIFGFLIWFPVPFMRRIILKISALLAERIMWYKWFGLAYILTYFIMVPLILFAFSFLIDLGVGGILLNLILDALLIVGVLAGTWKIDKIGNFLRLPAQKP
jgi:sodium-dependent phosphate cotransporter